MAVTVPAPPTPGRRPTGMPDTVPLRSPASPLTQVLAVVSVLVVVAALANAFDEALVFLLPASALVAGVVLGIGLELRASFRTLPGAVWAVATIFGLAALGVALAWAQVPITGDSLWALPLAGLLVLGLDWAWAERTRAVAVASGVVLVPLVADESEPVLAIAVVWFGAVAATLWSARSDVHAALPRPREVPGLAGTDREPAPTGAVVGLVAAWVVAAAVVALLGLVVFRPDPPDTSFPDGGPPFDTVDPGGGQSGPRDSWQTGTGDGSGGVGGSGGDPGTDGGSGVAGDPSGRGEAPSGGTAGSGGGAFDDPGADDGDSPLIDGDAAAGGGAAIARVLAIVAGIAVLGALLYVLGRAVNDRLARAQARAARPWELKLAERIEVEGRRRGRRRHRSETVTGYADALADGVLPDPRLSDVGRAVSAALFGPGGVDDGVGAWATTVLDEAVAAHPAPHAWDGARRRAPGFRAGAGNGV